MTTPDPRDRALEALLRRQGRGLSSPDGCLDAETLAAWADDGLDDTTRASAEAHVADCARCQALVATVVRTEPVPAPAEAPTLWHRLGLRWLVPLTAAAAAVVLWVAAPPPAPEAPADTIAAAPAAIEQARPVERDTVEPPPARPSEGAAFRQAAPPIIAPPAAPAAAAPPAVSSAASGSRAGEATGAKPDVAALESKRDAGASPDERQRLAKQAAPAADALTELTSREERAADEPLPAPPPAPSENAASPSPARAAAGGATAIGRTTGASSSALADRSATPGIVSGDPAVQWRTAGPGAIERSTNGGTSWDRLPTGVAGEITAGAAPAATVCWLVGRDGLVLVTTDVRTWRRVSSPVAADLVAVTAADARTATVRAVDGAQFRTTDGGATWMRLR